MEFTNINGKGKNRRKPSIDLSTMVYGKIPPQAKELEEAILGACMLDNSAFTNVVTILKPACFYVDAHQRIFKAFLTLFSRNVNIDLLTTVEELKRSEELDIVGGAYAISKLTNMVVSGANAEAHARIILQKFIQRELIRISGEIIGDAYEDSIDVFDLVDKAGQMFFSVTSSLYSTNATDMTLNVMKSLTRIENKVQTAAEGKMTGVPSGFIDLDRVTGGFQSTDLIILAARPSVGKTAFILNVTKRTAQHPKQKTGVLFFSLEMSTDQLVQRLLSEGTEIPLEKIRDGDLNPVEVKALHLYGSQLAELPIYIDDTATLNVLEVKSKSRKLVDKKEVGLIVIDYLQLMSGLNDGTHKNKAEVVGEISRQLKILAKELGVPVIALSQMSRNIETRTDKEPNLSDLRESGAIEQDADLVAFLYVEAGIHKFKIAKHRNGKLKKIKFKAKLEIQRFVDYEVDLDTGTSTPVNTSTSGDFTEGIQEAENEFSFTKKTK